MNLVFADETLLENPQWKLDWDREIPVLSRWNHLLLWGGTSSFNLVNSFGNTLILSGNSLKATLLDSQLSLDETALLGYSEAHIEAAQIASIPCFGLTSDAEVQKRLIIAGAENVFENVEALTNRIAKTNLIERRLFPVMTVGGLVRDAEGNWLLVQTRKWANQWGVPGGKVEYGETMEAALIREFKEETGLDIKNSHLVLVQEAIEHPEFYRPRHFILVNFIAEVQGRQPKVKLNHEGVDYLWLKPKEAVQLSLNGPTRLLINTVLEGESAWIS